MEQASTEWKSQPSIVYELESILHRVDLAKLFPRRQPLELELGSGDGSFLVAYAAMHPTRNFIGVERLLGRVQKLDRKSRKAGVDNLRAIRIESGYFLEYLLPACGVEAIHLYFPDPWPKRKHRRHRLVNDRFPALTRKVLVPNGRVHLRTDDADYFAQMQNVFQSVPDFQRVETLSELLAVKTDFERDFNARGIPTLLASYQIRG